MRARRLPHPLREVAIALAGYLTYFGVRAVTQGDVADAFAHARDVMRLEDRLGVAWEATIQRGLLDNQTLIEVANAVYIYGHWPVIVGAGVLLYRFRRDRYRLMRNTMLISGAVGLFVFALYPVAPPRMADAAVVDTVTVHTGSYRGIFPAWLVNEYAAMPSFHVGWNLAVAIALFGASRALAVRTFSVMMPILQTAAVVVTANHYVLDVVAGAAIVLVAIALLRWRTAASGRTVRKSSIAASTPSATFTAVMPTCMPREKDTADEVVATP